MIRLVVPIYLVLIVSTVSGEPRSQSCARDNANSPRQKYRVPRLFNFEVYKQLFHKTYNSIAEDFARKKIFWARAIRAFLSGVAYKHRKSSDYLAINHMSDWTKGELRTLHNRVDEDEVYTEQLKAHRPLSKPKKRNKLHEEHLDDTGSSSGSCFKFPCFSGHSNEISCKNESDTLFVDHRGCMSKVQRQGFCGSCYVFAVSSYFEWLHCNKMGELIKFSEQYVLDCGPDTQVGSANNLGGCRGGRVTAVARYFERYGAELAKDYPYKARSGYCPYGNPEENYEWMGYLKFDQTLSHFIALFSDEFVHFIEYSPIVVNLQLRPRFNEYGGGVDEGKSCCDRDKVAACYIHSVVIVGYGRQDDKEYWLIRNSFSSHWGEKGYYKLSVQAEHCIRGGGGIAFATDDGVRHHYNVQINIDRPPLLIGLKHKNRIKKKKKSCLLR